MTRDELEFSISQYLDGTLRPLERTALEERLASDAEARALLEEYRRLDVVVRQASPVPQIAWDRLAGQIQQAVAGEEVPVRHFSIGWVGRMAVAACVVFAVGLAVFMARNPSRPAGKAMVSGPAAQSASGPVVAQIQIGPSPAVASTWRAAEEVVARPTVVLIDRAYVSRQDNDSILY